MNIPAGEIDDEAGDVIGSSPLPRRPLHSAKQRADHKLKATAIPVLITVGSLLLLLGIWGTAVLAGAEVPLHDKPGADRMATAMALVGYPLGASLLGGAAFFYLQLKKAKAKK